MPSPEYTISINTTKYIGDYKISASSNAVPPPPPPYLEPGSTSVHEAIHTVTAEVNGTPVKSVTIVPGPGYSGLTELSSFDPVAAVAPHAYGCNGTSYDIFIAGQVLGHNVGSLGGVARNIIGNHTEEIWSITNALETNKTLSGYDVRRLMGEVVDLKNKQKNPTAELSISKPDGSQNKISGLRYTGGIVMFPGKWVNLGGVKSAGTR